MHAATGGLLARRWNANLTRHRIDPPLVSDYDSGLLVTLSAIAEGVPGRLHFLPLPGSSSTISASTTSSPSPGVDDPGAPASPPAAEAPAGLSLYSAWPIAWDSVASFSIAVRMASESLHLRACWAAPSVAVTLSLTSDGSLSFLSFRIFSVW